MPSRAEGKITVLLELAIANAFVSELFDRECIRRGLRPAQVGMLILVERHGPVTPTALEQESGWAGTTQRERLQELVEDGYIRRVPNEADRRSYFVETTAKGRKFLDATAPAIVAVEEELSRRLGVPVETYREPLERLHACARTALAELSAPAAQRA